MGAELRPERCWIGVGMAFLGEKAPPVMLLSITSVSLSLQVGLRRLFPMLRVLYERNLSVL